MFNYFLECPFHPNVPPQDELLAKFVVNSHRKHHPSNVSMETEQHGEGMEQVGAKVELIPQDILRKYIIYSKEKIRPRLHQIDQDKIAKLYAELRKESMVRWCGNGDWTMVGLCGNGNWTMVGLCGNGNWTMLRWCGNGDWTMVRLLGNVDFV